MAVTEDGTPVTGCGIIGEVTMYGLTFLRGALVGQIGSSDIFLVGSMFDGMANASGELNLFMWDVSHHDNSDGLHVKLSGFSATSTIPLPAGMGLLPGGLGVPGALGRRRKLS